MSVTNLMTFDRHSLVLLCSHITCYYNLLFESDKNNASVTGFLLTLFFCFESFFVCAKNCVLRFVWLSYFSFFFPWSLAYIVLKAKALALAINPDTTPAEPHLTSNTQQTKNETTNVVIQQHSRKLLMMGILMPETCWVYKKESKIASDI